MLREGEVKLAYQELKKSLNDVKVLIDGLVDLEESEGVTDDEILNVIDPLLEGMHGIRRRLEIDIDDLKEEKYLIRETKEDIFRKMAVGY